MRRLVIAGLRTAPLLALLALPAACLAESVDFEFRTLAREGPAVVAEGRREYVPADTLVDEIRTDGARRFVTKSLPLGNGFAIGLDEYDQPQLRGLGFWLHRIPSAVEKDSYPGYSWEWFDRKDSDVFVKRVGSGRIRVGTRRVDGLEKIDRVEFLDDVRLQVSTDRYGKADDFSHEILVRKGSVLAFPSR